MESESIVRWPQLGVNDSCTNNTNAADTVKDSEVPTSMCYQTRFWVYIGHSAG